MKRLLILLALCAAASACGGNSSTSPAPVTTTTKIINISGNLAFGSVAVGSTAQLPFTITNSGNATLTITGMNAVGGSGNAGYTASPTTGTVPAGGSLVVTVFFKPLTGGFFSNVLTVAGDQTSGNAAINVSGTGIDNTPVFTASGSGNTVFDIPSKVKRIHITGTFNGNSSNFIVKIAGSTVVNDLLGSFWGQTVSDGVYLIAGGGTAQIIDSLGVSWTFTEVR